MTPQQQQLLDLFAKLSADDARTLIKFAAFLADAPQALNLSPGETTVADIPKPNLIPRPEQERVVDAIKRLSESYPMLDKKKLLSQTAGSVAEHVMGGKPAKVVIDEIENSFRRAYELFVGQQRGS